jgi:hypothetical protein
MLFGITKTIHHGRANVGHVLLSLIFILARVALASAGLRFSFSLDWMWMADPLDLRDRLAETLYYFHAFPPGMNLVTGLLLKAAPEDPGHAAHLLFAAMGLLLVNLVFALGQRVGLSRRVAFVVAAALALLPAEIYFEHLYLYELPITMVLCLAAVLFHRAMRLASTSAWLAFFATCAVIGVTRSTFHLLWFVVMAALALWFTKPGTRRHVVVATIAPLLLLAGVYGKNLALFGEFAASTFGPASFHLVTVDRLPLAERNQWIAEGTLSPFAAVSAYAPPRDYVRFFETSEHAGWPPQLTRLEHPSVKAANFNHWFLLKVHRARRQDVLHYLRARPWGYVRNVEAGLRDLFRPSTEWHPRTGTDRSPHAQHRQVLGGYERGYNGLVHRFPVAPFGLYGFLPIVWLWGLWQAICLVRRGGSDDRARGALLLFCLFQILYVVAASSMLTFLEESRYRFQVEPLIWLVTTLCVTTVYGHLSDRRHL